MGECSARVGWAGCVLHRSAPSSLPPDGARRGLVCGFSSKSRRRLLERLAFLDWSVPALFVTLTYPSVWPQDAMMWHLQLERFIQLLLRRRDSPVTGLVWRLEFQARGAPHFHLVVFLSRRVKLDVVRRWVSARWYYCVDSGDIRHLRAGTKVQLVRSGRADRLMAYLAKYLSKVEGRIVGHTGRVWGVWGALPGGKSFSRRLSWCEWVVFAERCRAYGQATGSRFLGSFTEYCFGALLFGGFALWERLLDGLGVPCGLQAGAAETVS